VDINTCTRPNAFRLISFVRKKHTTGERELAISHNVDDIKPDDNLAEIWMDQSKISQAHKQEQWFGERCFIRELVNTPEIEAFSLAKTRVEPGVTTQLHTLDVHEWYVIQSGIGRMEVGGNAWFDVAPGDVIPIAAQVPQRIHNTSDTDLVFTCVCLPRFTPESYTSLE